MTVMPGRLEDLLADRLAPVLRRARRAQLLTAWAAIGGAAAVVAMLLRLGEERRGWNVGHGWTLLLLATLAAAGWAWHRARQRVGDPRQAARLIESREPELRALLLTAVAQAPPEPGGQLGYLQEQLLRQAIDRSDPVRWGQAVSNRRLGGLGAGGALGGLVVGYCVLTGLAPDLPSLFDDDYGLRVTPGHTQAERGNNVLVLARFNKRLPARATLVVRLPGRPPARVEMRRTLDDPVWGGLTPALAGERVEYFVEHDGGRSPRFRIEVYHRPEVERIDARVDYPKQPAVPARDIVDARFLSVMEGARVTVTVRLAAPGQEVRLQAPQAETVRLAARPGGREREFWGTLAPARSRRYDVLVVDNEGRRNPTPPRLTIDVHRNQPPEITLAFPGRDVRVSPLEELAVEARIRDDAAVLAYGLGFRLAGRPAQELRLGDGSGGGKVAAAPVLARATIALETLGAKPDELVTYHFWAEDRDGSGKLRRTSSDMYFAEVRPFEERYRERSSDGEDAGMGGQGAQLADRVRRQKEIMNATWRLEREARDGRPPAELGKDAEVVARSQDQLKQSTEELRGEARDGRTRAALEAAARDMGAAHRSLQLASRQASARASAVPQLASALEAEQRAYAALLRLREREHDVTRGRSQGQGGGAGESPELSGLELKQKENRYETRREAGGPQQTGRPDREALGRLEELARRQQALSERMKEAQAALEKAPDADPAEQERRLKRLREEQQELLQDMDQLAQRLENAQQSAAARGSTAGEQANAAERERLREALERTRAELERSRREAAAAAEALAQGRTGEALGASTRAERELERTRRDLAKEVGAGLEDEMRTLRDAARQLDENQQKIGQALGGPPPSGETAPGLQPPEPTNPTTARRLATELERQKRQAAQLLRQLEGVSGEAETSAPLLSRKLYEGLREAKMNDLEGALGNAGELLQRNLADEARASEARARQSIGALRGQVDEAAKGVLGDEAQALRAAQTQIDELMSEAAREATGDPGQPPAPGQNQSTTPGRSQSSTPGRNQPPTGGPAQAATGSGPGDNAGPITGDGFRQFAERLRDLEDLLDEAGMRNQAAGVRDRARAMRADWRYQSKRPSQALMRAQILGPLTELRDKLSERLNRLERNQKLVPLDRDPIPGRYTDLVRRYWKSLSQGQ